MERVLQHMWVAVVLFAAASFAQVEHVPPLGGPEAAVSSGEPARAADVNALINQLRAEIQINRDLIRVLSTAAPGLQGVTCRESEVGQFEIGCGERPCGDDNPAWVVLRTGSPPGHHERIRLNRNIIFTDTLALPLATTAGVPWVSARPFFLYAVLSPNFDDVGFALSPNPARSESPDVDHITWRGHVNRPADDDTFFMLEADQPWARRPVLLLGRVGLRKDAQDNWTLADGVPGAAATMTPHDCIGPIDESTSWTFPIGQMGAVDDYLSTGTGRAAPTWRNAAGYEYWLRRDGTVRIAWATETANSIVAQNGQIDAPLRVHLPYRIGRDGANEWYSIGVVTFEEPPSFAFPRPMVGRRNGVGAPSQAVLDLFTLMVPVPPASDSVLVHVEADWFNSAPNDSEISVNFSYRAF